MSKLKVSLPMWLEKTDSDSHVAWRIHPSRHTVDLAIYDDHVEFTFHDVAVGQLPHLVELIHSGFEVES